MHLLSTVVFLAVICNFASAGPEANHFPCDPATDPKVPGHDAICMVKDRNGPNTITKYVIADRIAPRQGGGWMCPSGLGTGKCCPDNWIDRKANKIVGPVSKCIDSPGFKN
ncbi:hypothetical protein Pst134EB_018150 [Puccinia striiformis f. sp. tritici]|nr:hypothetical protein Pst134EB_018150 [Puccinia striiformis f. sp. tritici]